MTLVSDIIQQAYRETNLIPVGVAPTSGQITEGLARLNTIVQSAVGYEVGDPGFRDITIGGDFDQSELVAAYVPDNARLILNLDAAIIIGLCPNPYEGQRVSIVDALANVGTYNVTIDGNGRQIESTTDITLVDDGISRQWIYRADTGNWMRVYPLAVDDLFPYPEEFDDYFVIFLAMRLNPRYSQTMSPESLAVWRQDRGKLRARFGRVKEVLPDSALLGLENDKRLGWTNVDAFNLGKPHNFGDC